MICQGMITVQANGESMISENGDLIQTWIYAPGIYAITSGWPKALWNAKFYQHFHTWKALGIKPQTF